MNDLISRQAAIDALIRKNQPVYNGDGTVTITIMSDGVIKETLEKLPSAQPDMNAVVDVPSVDKWIPTDYNPMTTNLYLVLCNEWGGDRVRICSYYNETGKWIKDGKNITKHVTHWMPLPEPPKDVKV